VIRKLQFTCFMLLLVFLDALFVIAVLTIGRIVAEADHILWPNAHNGFFETMEIISLTVGCILYILFVILTLVISVTYLRDEIKEILTK